MIHSVSAFSAAFKHSVASLIIFALVVVASVTAPSRASAGDGFAKAAAAALIICAMGACKKKSGGKKRRAGKSGGKKKAKGPTDAVAMTKDQRILIQDGLTQTGHYTGALDGALGKGSRAAMRSWQTASAYTVTGVLTGAQINELIAASSRYAGLPADSPMWYEAEIARDLDKTGMRSLQDALKAAGYAAGPTDGSLGPSTKRAIVAYKADSALPGGAYATRRLLARVEGRTYTPAASPTVMSAELDEGATGSDSGDTPQTMSLVSTDLAGVTKASAAASEPEVASADVRFFEIAGVRLGMPEAEITEITGLELETEFDVLTRSASAFNGAGPINQANLLIDRNWPAPSSNFIASFHDESQPDAGAVAIFRSIMLPEGLTRAQIEASILPDMIDAYGREAYVDGAMTFVGSGSARSEARDDVATLASCGEPVVSHLSMEAMSDDSETIKFDPASLSTATRDCGNVLSIKYTESRIDLLLWDAGVLTKGAEAAVVIPKIKF